MRSSDRARNSCTPSSISLQIRETVDLEIPDSLPRARTRSSTLRVETPSIQAEQITAYRALSTLRRGWSREGKNDPVRSLGMASSTSPAVVATVLRRLPLRLLVRCGVRDVALRADHGGGPEPRPGPCGPAWGRRRKTSS